MDHLVTRLVVRAKQTCHQPSSIILSCQHCMEPVSSKCKSLWYGRQAVVQPRRLSDERIAPSKSLPQSWPTAAMVVRRHMGSEHSSSTRQTCKFHLKHPNAVIRVGTECSGMEPLPWVFKRLGLLDAFQLAFFVRKGPSLTPRDHTMSGCMGTNKRTRRHQSHHAHRHHGPKSKGSARP